MAAPEWAPSTANVAAYVTSRTLSIATPGDDTPAADFGTDTTPTQAQVEQLIADACDWVTAVAGTPTTTLEGLAKAAAAMRVAGLVEASYPERDADVNTAQLLLAQAEQARADLAAANSAATGTNPTAPGGGLKPAWSFPEPTWPGDYPI